MTDDEARRAIVEALEDTRGNVERARHLLGVSRRQMYRYLWAIPGLWQEADRIRQAAWDAHMAARRRLGYKGEHGPRPEPGS